ncbi:MAG TPA: CHAT domain-containing protein [Pyrinomonadaceae bacterium]|nr:CHAT domain-containing protein [Pyrinomonadaceae bacterium]
MVWILFLLVLAVLSANGQLVKNKPEFTQAQEAFDKGNFVKAIQLAETVLNKKFSSTQTSTKLKGWEIIAYSQTSLGKFDEAEATIQNALKMVSETEIDPYQKASVYFCASWLKRRQRQIPEAFNFSQKALSINPNDLQLRGEYYLNIGRILFSLGYDLSAIIWLEKAEKILSQQRPLNPIVLEVYRFLSHAWASKANFQLALLYSEKFLSLVQGTEFKYKYRQALFERGTLLSTIGQKEKAFDLFRKGLQSALVDKELYYSRSFLNTIILNLLYENDSSTAAEYLPQLEKLDEDQEFSNEILLIKAVLLAFNGKKEESERIFQELGKRKQSSDYLLLSWKTVIAERSGEWEKLVDFAKELRELSEKYADRDELPRTEFLLAKAYFHLNQIENARNHLTTSLSLIEELRGSSESNLSLGVSETYHEAYRLLIQMKFDNPEESFVKADFLKARVLRDRIENSPLRGTPMISNVIRQKLDELTSKFIENQSISVEIEEIEKKITSQIPELNLKESDFSELKKISGLENTAIISYFFRLDKKLMAFVWEKGKIIQTIELPITENEFEKVATQTYQNIKSSVFFKRDGKAIYDKLLKPLNLTAKHLIIIPDKSLWKIPFQALSSDGERYLIEEKLISYAPSVSILLEQLKAARANRQTLQAFANSSFETKLLQYVNSEATTVAGIYNSNPIINATIGDFSRVSEKFDILHFSMHAEVANDEPLDSFLGFRKIGNDDGRLTVEDLLNIKLKKGSLVFLASCDTNRVFSGEGLVSLAWGMMGAGATTVISTQWEANDKSTAVFTNSFYKNYKQGVSVAEAMQKAALELIRNKSNNMHEPYYWADFTLNGDFR